MMHFNTFGFIAFFYSLLQESQLPFTLKRCFCKLPLALTLTIITINSSMDNMLDIFFIFYLFFTKIHATLAAFCFCDECSSGCIGQANVSFLDFAFVAFIFMVTSFFSALHFLFFYNYCCKQKA